MANIDAKKAAQAAASYLNEIRDLVDAKLKDVRLEEIELLETQNMWLITLGYDVPAPYQPSSSIFSQANVTAGLMNPSYKRDYKTFQVSAETGEVQSMKIRSVS
jgi:hypothetical protein